MAAEHINLGTHTIKEGDSLNRLANTLEHSDEGWSFVADPATVLHGVATAVPDEGLDEMGVGSADELSRQLNSGMDIDTVPDISFYAMRVTDIIDGEIWLRDLKTETRQLTVSSTILEDHIGKTVFQTH